MITAHLGKYLCQCTLVGMIQNWRHCGYTVESRLSGVPISGGRVTPNIFSVGLVSYMPIKIIPEKLIYDKSSLNIIVPNNKC